MCNKILKFKNQRVEFLANNFIILINHPKRYCIQSVSKKVLYIFLGKAASYFPKKN